MEADDDLRSRSILVGTHPILETPFALDAAHSGDHFPLLSTGMVSGDGRGLLGRGLSAVPVDPFKEAERVLYLSSQRTK
jgi:hypothetical protein